ncbi:MarR family winged helix-turn-helix transcriptional regulator [Streptomonospora nanhaiensis]|uniref:DNA-binding MarR family transcriptional regulator n=1 Tax=Streptomonospora nanhaiensis TaxID=1323731 RepID=A0A853BVU9_9ACTN|nr:MarR family transcriptional regulator [Streptomonospora nanhaiensis]NYI98332.1 DNA-binding MarR family transcriptional regulator [Streptomonospora nanhaiensis]
MDTSRRAAAEAFGRAIQRYQRSVQNFDDEVGRALDLGAAELRCLDWLSEAAMPAGELARAVGLRPAATTALVDRLSRRGLVRREASAADRRKVLVALTDEGRRLLWEMYGPVVRDGQRLLEGFGAEEIAAMERLISRMARNAEEHTRRVAERSRAPRGRRG